MDQLKQSNTRFLGLIEWKDRKLREETYIFAIYTTYNFLYIFYKSVYIYILIIIYIYICISISVY